jgi:hypothetical protein
VLTRIFGPAREQERKELEAGENCIMRNYTIFILHQILECVCKFYLKICRGNRIHAGNIGVEWRDKDKNCT